MSIIFNSKLFVVGFAVVGLQLAAAASIGSSMENEGSVEEVGSNTSTQNTDTESVIVLTADDDNFGDANVYVVSGDHMIMVILMSFGISGGILAYMLCHMFFVHACCCSRCREAAEAPRNGNRALRRPRLEVHPIRRLYDLELSQRHAQR